VGSAGALLAAGFGNK
jgi:hypothetical protein